MFTAVYKEGGGNVLQLITNLKKVLRDLQLREQNVLANYTALGEGEGQTTDQYLGMLYKALSQ